MLFSQLLLFLLPSQPDIVIKGKDQYWKRPNFKKMKWKLSLPIMWKNMFWLIHDDNKFAGKPPTNSYIW